MQEGWW